VHVNNVEPVVHIINNVIIDNDTYDSYVNYFNKHFSHIKYIKNDDDKFLYIVEEISSRNLIKKVYIVGTIVGIGFGLYIFYKNIFK